MKQTTPPAGRRIRKYNPAVQYYGGPGNMEARKAFFWARVKGEDEDACWEWPGVRNGKGYGVCRKNGKLAKAHRVAWEFTNGEITKGKLICHSCDNPPCCNPRHLFLGTARTNYDDMVAKGRANHRHTNRATGEKHHATKLTEAQVVEMRLRYGRGEPVGSLAREFKVSKKTVANIGTGSSWVLVPGGGAELKARRKMALQVGGGVKT